MKRVILLTSAFVHFIGISIVFPFLFCVSGPVIGAVFSEPVVAGLTRPGARAPAPPQPRGCFLGEVRAAFMDLRLQSWRRVAARSRMAQQKSFGANRSEASSGNSATTVTKA